MRHAITTHQPSEPGPVPGFRISGDFVMADYHSPTVVQPSIPSAAITPLELTLLTAMFEHEIDDDAIYFYSSEGPSGVIWLDIAELKVLLEAEVLPSGPIVETIRKTLAESGSDETELELDLSDLGEATIFQGIVRRCAQLDHVTIVSAWTCTKMRPDGFGGGITVVTADHILSSSTIHMEGELLDRAEHGDLACAPGHGCHAVLGLAEEDVRSMVTDIQTAYPETDIGAVKVADTHIREGVLQTLPKLDFGEELRSIEFRAAWAAIRIAQGAST